MTRVYTLHHSPIGTLRLESDGVSLTGLFADEEIEEMEDNVAIRDDAAAPFADAKEQLARYFDGTRTRFDLPLAPAGTEFDKCVWAELAMIPYGETVTYGEIARRIGQPRAVRAVGRANGRNPLLLVVPCHRVVGADGRLTGYRGGIERKQALLALEASVRAEADRYSGGIA